jgi:hypothetical protein
VWAAVIGPSVASRIPGDIHLQRSGSFIVSPPAASRRISCPISSPCQTFARNCATRGLTIPHDAFSSSASHLSECVRTQGAARVANHPRIDGKDGVAGTSWGSRTQGGKALTAACPRRADRRSSPGARDVSSAIRYAGCCSTRAPAARIAASARSPSPGCRSTARTSSPSTTVSNPNRAASSVVSFTQ